MLSLRTLALRLMASAVLMAGIACDKPAEPPAAPTAFGEHRVAEFSGTANKGLGEDCGQFGAAECKSGLCLHVSPMPNAGYLCSAQCSKAEDCPSGWRCARAGLSGGPAYCLRDAKGGTQ